MKSAAKSDWNGSDYSSLGMFLKVLGLPQVEIISRLLIHALPFQPLPLHALPCPSILSFSTLSTRDTSSPPAAPQNCSLMSFNPPQKDNFASVHQHLHFYFKLGFQALPENSWWLVSLPECCELSGLESADIQRQGTLESVDFQAISV